MKRKQIKELDKLWAGKVKHRAGFKCEKCGKTTALHSHHIYPRTYWPVRWNIHNGVCLCSGCHLFWAHKDPLDFTEWIKQRRPQVRFLGVLRFSKDKQDYETALEGLM